MEAARQSPKPRLELVVWCQCRPRGTEASWENAAEHSQAQRCGKNSWKHNASHLASECQPCSLLVSSHWGRGRLSCKGSLQLKAFVQQHHLWEIFLFAPRGEYFLWVKRSPFSHIPFAINAAVVIVILVKLFIHYLKGWGEGSSLLGAVFPVLDKMSTLVFRSLSLLHKQYLLRPLGLKTLEYRKIQAIDTIPFTMLLFTITHLHKFV